MTQASFNFFFETDKLAPEELEVCRQAHEQMMEEAFRYGPPEGPIGCQPIVVLEPRKVLLKELVAAMRDQPRLIIHQEKTLDEINAELQIAHHEQKHRRY